MSPGNRPKFNSASRLTPNGGGPAGERAGSAPERNQAGPPRVSRPALRRFFAPGTPASVVAASGRSGGLPADIDELAAPIVGSGRAAGVEAVELASAAPAAGPDIELDARPARRGHRRVVQRRGVPADVARVNPCTPPPAGTAATRR